MNKIKEWIPLAIAFAVIFVAGCSLCFEIHYVLTTWAADKAYLHKLEIEMGAVIDPDKNPTPGILRDHENYNRGVTNALDSLPLIHLEATINGSNWNRLDELNVARARLLK